MLTGIGAPTAWPFFKHSATVPPPVRTALGTVYDTSVPFIQLAGINLALGDLLLVGTINDNGLSASAVEVDVDANLLTQDIIQAQGELLVSMNSWLVTGAIVGGTITATWTVDDPNTMAFVAVKVSNLTGTLAETQSVACGVTANPDSGLTGLYAAASSFHWGLVGTEGRATDTLGNWQNTMTAGQRRSSGGVLIDLKEGYRLPIFPAWARAQILLQSPRASIAMIGYYE